MMPEGHDRRFETLAVIAGEEPEVGPDDVGDVTVPIHLASTFAVPDVDMDHGQEKEHKEGGQVADELRHVPEGELHGDQDLAELEHHAAQYDKALQHGQTDDKQEGELLKQLPVQHLVHAHCPLARSFQRNPYQIEADSQPVEKVLIQQGVEKVQVTARKKFKLEA